MPVVYVAFKNISLILKSHHCRIEALKNLVFCSVLMAFELETNLYVIFAVTQDLGFSGRKGQSFLAIPPMSQASSTKDLF